MNLNDLAKKITTNYDIQEARSIVRLLLSDYFHLSLTDICCGALERFSADEQARLNSAIDRLNSGEPIQYITGKAFFCDRSFHVEPGVLIPRPETEELCTIITEEHSGKPHTDILDIGTGSGCIAITLALNLPHSTTTAWDVSDDALAIARRNAESNNAAVCFQHVDILNTATYPADAHFDVIVSNPPYICRKEAADMEPHVLNHEPHLALFVPDDSPLLFYSAITRYATQALKPHGMLYFEINPLYATEMTQLLRSYNFCNVSTIKDSFGKDRFVKGER